MRDTCGIVVAETRYPKIDLTVFLYTGTDIESSRIMIVVTFDHLCIDWRKWVAFFEPAFNFSIWLPFRFKKTPFDGVPSAVFRGKRHTYALVHFQIVLTAYG